MSFWKAKCCGNTVRSEDSEVPNPLVRVAIPIIKEWLQTWAANTVRLTLENAN